MGEGEHSQVIGVVYRHIDLKTGDKYDGWVDSEAKKAKRHGNGMCKFRNGDQYVGGWERDQMHGFGKMTYSNGDKYAGSWKTGVMHGFGEYTYKTGEFKGSVYKGDMKVGQRHGKGRMQYANGDVYVGLWKEDKRSGRGVLTKANSAPVHGEWSQDKMTRELEDWELDDESEFEVDTEEDDEPQQKERNSCASLFSWKGIKAIFGGSDDEDDSKPDKPKKSKTKFKGKAGKADSGNKPQRRVGVSAEAQEDVEDTGERVVHSKTPQQRERIAKGCKSNFLFNNCTPEQLDEIFDAMFESHKQPGQTIIEMDDKVAEHFYIIDSGECEVFVKGEDGNEKSVATIGPGGSFGEIALMYSVPRTATVKAKTQCVLWALDRVTFRRIIVSSQNATTKLYEGFLNHIPILDPLTQKEKGELADAMQPKHFKDGDVIIKQGVKGDEFYIIEEGEAKVTVQKKPGKGKMKEVAILKKGDYFGEQALLTDNPRAANVISLGPSKCIYCDRATFQRLLGPAEEALKANMKQRADGLSKKGK
eukprot:TRINITY_DN2446_c1_g1_i4.p1 TRINITY_DN2446_c1_g1~~TRINITY_DN2446_c1_g1_i4.p1  ORF type:complete len:532 (+),score=176.59 TRINITY_DN2446_c1_g1_i4:427-2022(+)